MPPSALLADGPVSVQGAAEQGEPGAAVLRYLADGSGEFGAVDRVAPGERVHVGEVVPPGIRGSPSDRGDDLLCVNHRERVSAHRDCPAEDAG
jgi:hypothetical protein